MDLDPAAPARLTFIFTPIARSPIMPRECAIAVESAAMLDWIRRQVSRITPRGEAGAAPEDLSPEQRRLLDEVSRYTWYHEIELAPGVRTRSEFGGFPQIWEFIRQALEQVEFTDRRVLDVGCRDGMFSLEAERRGAACVDAIDNDLSPGAVELLLPHFKSRVAMRRLNLYDLDPAAQPPYDVIMFFGVLYHLRYPFWGLKRLVDCLAPRGELLIESGMLVDTPATGESELLFCPVDTSPYEPTSCTFFNRRGLETSLRSLGLEPLDFRRLEGSQCRDRAGRLDVERQFLRFRRRERPPEEQGRQEYWDATHDYHSAEARVDPNVAHPARPGAEE